MEVTIVISEIYLSAEHSEETIYTNLYKLTVNTVHPSKFIEHIKGFEGIEKFNVILDEINTD